MDNSFELKLKAALAELEHTGMRPRYCKPPIHRLLWRMGINVRPPHYASFLSNLVFVALWFSVFLGSIMWFSFWSQRAMSFVDALSLVLSAGGALGLLLATYYWFGQRKHRLTPWRKLLTES